MFNFYWLFINNSIYIQKVLFYTVNSQGILAEISWYLLMEESKKVYGESNVSFSENLFWVKNSSLFLSPGARFEYPLSFFLARRDKPKIKYALPRPFSPPSFFSPLSPPLPGGRGEGG